MKYVKTIFAGLMVCLLLVGCGASFDASSDTIKNFADTNSGAYSDVTSDFSDYDFVEGVYMAETNNVHIELWDLTSTQDAASWYNNNVEYLKADATSNAGSSTSSGGSHTITTPSNYYRVLFSNDKGIYVYGDKDAVDSALTEMSITK